MIMLISLYLLLISMMNFFLSIYFYIMKKSFLINFLLMKFMSFNIELITYIDWMSMMFTSVVMMISSMVLIYSMSYMLNHYYIKRFMNLIIIFFLSMMLMIFSPNMISILIGWDGLGLSSFCLIIFYQNKKSYNSGINTILMNRIGDINILIMISLLFNHNTWNFLYILNMPPMIFIMIIMASITKSAQIPFSTWLPMAMAAPTPVSSLVHSSTLVTAGIYLMIRLNYLFNNLFLFTLMFLSFWTLILASSSALFEFDLKKIIALSTLSQLSLMFLSLSMKLSMLSFFHMITHAMFKSLLFLCSGIIIHNYFNNQDIRLINNLSLNMPLISIIFNMASLTLCGMPFLSGFYSKDLIIEYFNIFNMNFFTFNMMYISMMLTIMYSFRLIYYISLKSSNYNFFNKSITNNKMINSIYLLFLLSMTYGTIINWILFNSLNLIILNLNFKLLIYKLSIISFLILFFLKIKIMIMKLLTLNIYFYNNMWFLPKMFYKCKYTQNIMNNYMIYLIDYSWLEKLSSKKFLFMIIKMNKYKKFNKLNFSVIMTFFMYLLMILLLY
nr:NADH dehydrogenase subunit 5 [Meteorus sp. 1 XHS-2023a]